MQDIVTLGEAQSATLGEKTVKSLIKNNATTPEYYFQEGCYITEWSNSSDDPDVSVAKARVRPGETTRWHRLLETTERYVLLSGQGLVEVGDMPPTPVSVGDVVVVAPMVRQRITNTGEEDLVFLAICSPRFLPENYQEC